MKQNALTLISEIEDHQLEKLRTLFSSRKEEFAGELGKVGTIQYARLVIVDKHTNQAGEVFAAQLVLSSNFDGDPDQQIQDIVNKIGPTLDLIYAHIKGYDKNNKLEFFRKSRTKEAAFYQGSPHRTLEVIRQEKALHQELFDLINSGNWKGKSASEIHESLKNSVFSKPEFAWAKKNIELPGINYLMAGFSILIIILLLPVIIIWVIILQVFHENKDVPLGLTPNQLDLKTMEHLEKDEDFYWQNQFSQVVDMKPGMMRIVTLLSFFALARVLVKAIFVKGKLMGIPTIHFARWVMINNNKRVLFFSNFDGSWTQYLGDFIDKSGWGLTGIFSNTRYFPKAFMLVTKGAYNQRQFLAWARYTQIQTQVWYAEDKGQSIKNINNNTAIRNAFPKKLTEAQAQKLLSWI